MAVSGPTFAGGGSSPNTTNLTFRPSVAIPVGSSVIVPIIIEGPDTTDVTVTGGTGNVFQQRAGSQDPGSTYTLFVFECLKTIGAIATNQNIAVGLSARLPCIAGAVFYGGLQGFCTSLTTQWDTVANPVINARANVDNETMLAVLVAGGPSSDGFTQDARWGADFLSGIGTGNFAVHGGSQTAALAGTFSYAPILATARRTSTMVASLL